MLLKIAFERRVISGWISIELLGILVFARSGSFNPFPVMTHTIVSLVNFCPNLDNLINPAKEAAEAGSPNIPSSDASNRYASKI